MLLFSFQCLIECRKNVCDKLGISLEDVELSMGMSNDFDKAVSPLFEERLPVSPHGEFAPTKFAPHRLI